MCGCAGPMAEHLSHGRAGRPIDGRARVLWRPGGRAAVAAHARRGLCQGLPPIALHRLSSTITHQARPAVAAAAAVPGQRGPLQRGSWVGRPWAQQRRRERKGGEGGGRGRSSQQPAAADEYASAAAAGGAAAGAAGAQAADLCAVVVSGGVCLPRTFLLLTRTDLSR